MRLLLVSHDLTPSGAPLLIVQLGRLLRRAGMIVRLASSGLGGGDHPAVVRRVREAGIELVALPPPTDRAQLIESYDMIVVNTVVVAPWVEALLAADAGPLGALCASRLVWWIHEIQPRYAKSLAAAALGRTGSVVFDSHTGLERWRGEVALPWASEAIYPSVADEFLQQAIFEVERSRSHDPRVREQAARGRVRRELGFGADDFVVLALSAVPAEKGALGVVEAVERLLVRARTAEAGRPPIRLIILGRCETADSRAIQQFLAQNAALLDTCVRLLPAVDDPSPYFAAADAVVVNTAAPGEMFGRVSIEAMAYRLPVLATDQGGSTEIVLNGVTGWLHDSQRPDELWDRLENLWQDRDQRRRLGEAGFRRVRTVFSEAEMAARWYRLAATVRRRRSIHVGAWTEGSPPSPFTHMEALACAAADRLVVFGGFARTSKDLNREIAILDLDRLVWSAGPPLPDPTRGEIALTHAGVATDGVWIFVVSGQPDPDCAAACRTAWALRLDTAEWIRLPDLPVARYSGGLHYWRGRLYLFPGNLEDRHTTCDEQWTLELRKPGAAPTETTQDLERRLRSAEWRSGPPRPSSGDHFASILQEEDGDQASIFFMGGEQGHAPLCAPNSPAMPGSYVAHYSFWRYDLPAGRWHRLPDLPIPVHHIEHQVVVLDRRFLVVLGGATHGSALVPFIQMYDTVAGVWQVLPEQLPYGLVGAIAWIHAGEVFLQGGQKWASPENRYAGLVTSTTWRATIEVLG